MKKSDLKQGMCVQTTHNRYGFVELDRNRIDFCYDPDVIKDEYAHLEKVSLDDVIEFGNEQLGIEAIQNFLDYEFDWEENKEVTDRRMDEAYY